MYIIDLDNKLIEVTDLTLAIMQADDYRHFENFNPDIKEFAEKRRTYWEDTYQKLLKLQAENP